MRYPRQNKILELISNNEIETQEKLASMLKDEGFEVTQATISRDIKDLQLIKVLSASGKYKYAVSSRHDAPISDRYPKEMYYRLFAAQYLPKELDRILYLDPDIVVINSLRSLYGIDFGDKLFAAASHIESHTFKNFNRRRLRLSQQARYINSGVMMMNLSLLRTQQKPEEIYRFIEEHKNSLLLPDQDVLNALYADRTIFLDPLIYNLGDKYLRLKNLHLPKGEKLGLEWVRQHTAIIHYYGRNKPWKEGYHGKLGVFYDFFVRELSNL